MKKTLTAPLALIQFNSVTVGKMRGVNLTETIRRARVTGIGRLNASELAAVEWSGSLSCDAYAINFNLLNNVLRLGTFRNAPTVDAWANALLLQEDGLEIAILRKVKATEPDPVTGLLEADYETFLKVTGAFATREGFNVSEGQLAGRNTDFEYLNPVLFNDIVEA